MDNQIFLPDRREAVAGVVADALGETRVIWDEFEVRPVDAREL